MRPYDCKLMNTDENQSKFVNIQGVEIALCFHVPSIFVGVVSGPNWACLLHHVLHVWGIIWDVLGIILNLWFCIN